MDLVTVERSESLTQGKWLPDLGRSLVDREDWSSSDMLLHLSMLLAALSTIDHTLSDDLADPPGNGGSKNGRSPLDRH